MTRKHSAVLLAASTALFAAAATTTAAQAAPFPWCPADVNFDGVVDKSDLWLFLDYWFKQDTAADINLDGKVSVQDIFDFLAIFARGQCPGAPVPIDPIIVTKPKVPSNQK